MGPELGVIELPNAALHVIIAQEFNHSCSILRDIGIAHISRLPHVVLQVLPAAGRGQACGEAKGNYKRKTQVFSLQCLSWSQATNHPANQMTKCESDILAICYGYWIQRYYGYIYIADTMSGSSNAQADTR